MSSPSASVASASAMSPAEFLALAVRSRLMTEERASDLTSKLRRKATSAELAQQLVSEGELTAFQAKKLSTGLWQGLMVGRFRILKPIGRGGMGVVYLAVDTAARGDRAKVALKILPPKKAAAEPRTRARFLREVAIGRELPKAPNIARVYETGIADGVAFIAMEYVPGRTVKSVVASQGTLAVSTAARLFAGVAHGLAATHEKGYIHRDVKPSNIMITPDGTAKLVDFGFALHTGETLEADPSVIGGAGYALGTFDFIPPEQVANAAAVTPLADQYSLGCSLYFALAGQAPFPGGSAREKMQKHRWEDPPRLASLRPDLPVEFTAIVERLMAKAPTDRFESCSIVAKILQTWSKADDSPLNIFAEDAFDGGEDDLDQLAGFRPARHRRAYHHGGTPLLMIALITGIVACLLGAATYLLTR